MKNHIDISVIGLGYIGLPTLVMFATSEKTVLGVDIDDEKLSLISEGKSHFTECQLDELLKNRIGRIQLSNKPLKARTHIVAVPTPVRKTAGKSSVKFPDLTLLYAAINSIIPVLERNNVVIIESTIPIGTTKNIYEYIVGKRPDLLKNDGELDIHLSHCPERVLPGNIIDELKNNGRVIGGIKLEDAQIASEIYRSFVIGEISLTTCEIAEASKLIENSYRDVQIAFANEISMLCDDIGIDVEELIYTANQHPRINILSPGPGVGGHCIAVDPWFLTSKYENNVEMIKLARSINTKKEQFTFCKIDQIITEKGFNEVLLCGVTYKQDINDLRESPSLNIAIKLFEKYKKIVKICEPNIDQNKINGIELLPVAEMPFFTGLIVYLVNHTEFKVHKPTQAKLIYDACGVTNKMSN